jgi:putative MATE family efflux protein
MILVMIGLCISPYLPHWLGASEHICHLSTEYFSIFCCGMPLIVINSLGAGSLRCSGNIETPSMLMVMMCVLDIVFNYIFIFQCGMGTAGAAYGTMMSYFITMTCMIYQMTIVDKNLRFAQDTESSYRPTIKILKKAGRIGAPIGLERGMMCSAMVMISSIIAPLGSVAIAANTFGINVESLCYMPGHGIADAATTLVGQSKGAERRDLMHSFAWIAMAMGVAIMAFMGLLMWIFAPEMMGLITPDRNVITLGTEVLRIEAWAEPGFAAAIIATSVFVGAGKTLIPSIMNFGSIWVVRVSLAMAMAPAYDLKGVWLAMAIELCFRGLIMTLRMCTRGWSYIKDRSERTFEVES